MGRWCSSSVPRGRSLIFPLLPPNYINPMDINLDYSDDENPITLKSDFILSLCDLIIGGKEGLSH